MAAERRCKQGPHTAIIGGFLISALGGSRFQIGGPAGAFIVLVASTVQAHGMAGLLLATLLAGLMLAAVGLLRLGTYVKFSPHPATVAFALLGAIESLLSAVVADGMTGRRHRSNCELVVQGAANVASSVFGGICVTGAIARTATNVRAGAHGSVAGMSHSVFLLLFVLLAARVASYIPLAALAGVFAVVAWTTVERGTFALGTVLDRISARARRVHRHPSRCASGALCARPEAAARALRALDRRGAR